MADAPLPGNFVYVHVPFCRQHCPYCDFFRVSNAHNAGERADAWLRLILREAELLADAGDLQMPGTPGSNLAPPAALVRTLYFGGGTPSLTSAAAMHEFLAAMRSRFEFAPDAEITIEMQPGTADQEKITAYAAAGINRFSVGVQTFDPALLECTRRRHSVEESRAMIKACAAAGALSLDLICAWPQQTLEMWEADVRAALEYHPQHISVYELTFHEHTEFAREVKAGRIVPADEDLRVAMFELTAQMLTAVGYEHYEVSNFALADGRSRHNENYWKLGNYVGLGAGAHSYVHPHRYVNANDVSGYEQAIRAHKLFRTLSDPPDQEIFALENLQMALRLSDGVNLDWFEQRYEFPLREQRGEALRQIIEAGFAEHHRSTLRLTHAGRLNIDSILEWLV